VSDPATRGESDAIDQAGEVPTAIRNRLALVLDVDDDIAALRLARELRPWFGIAKVGLELFTAAGPPIVETLRDGGYEVFVDLKLHDIPSTVNKAARVLGGLGATYTTIHAAGGVAMLHAGVEGFAEGARAAGVPAPTVLAVTVLTSDAGAPAHILPNRVAAALDAGAGGVVCAGSDVRDIRQLAPRLTIVVPGIRPAGSPTHDQVRATTPEDALAAGADVLVIGRAVTAADDPAAAAASLVQSLHGL
jgi:orotidine-5'-phosphate decarboxylase